MNNKYIQRVPTMRIGMIIGIVLGRALWGLVLDAESSKKKPRQNLLDAERGRDRLTVNN